MFSKNKEPRLRSESYVGAKKFWAWESRELSDAAFNFLMGYIVFFCTDVLKVDPLIVGSLFAASKVVDGITDIAAGYIVDRTDTKWGRGRPYDVCLIGAWVSIVLIFICPVGWSDGAKIAWVVCFYTLANSVFYTFLNAGEGVFFLRTFTRPQAVKMTAQGNIATSLLGLLCGMFLPQMVNNAGKDPAAWMKMVVTIAIPLTLIGLCRMLFVKEENDEVETIEEKVKTDLSAIIKMLCKNKYWLIFCTITLVGSTISSMGVMVYYFDKILGNLGIQSIFAGASALAVFALVLLPKLLKKYHFQKILMVGQIASAVLNAICFIFYDNIPVLVLCYVMNMFAVLPGTHAVRLILFDSAIYNEYLGMNRMEGSMSSVHGFSKRAGGAMGSFFLGLALKVIKYDPDATVLAPITFWGLRFMMYGLPVVFAICQALIWMLYDLEKRLPKIKEELAARKLANGSQAQ